MHFARFTTRAPFVTKNHQSNGYAMSPTSSETSIFRALVVTKNRQSCGYLRAAQWLAILLLMLTCSVMALAQTMSLTQTAAEGAESEWIVFVSQRAGASELYLLNLNTRQVSQLTNTGRGHLAPATAAQARTLAFASREGSNYELFTASISSDWRTRRPLLAAVNRLTINTIDELSPSLSADGKLMAFGSGHGIELMFANGQGRRVLVPADEALIDLAPSLSPDGRQVAFISNRSGAMEIWLADTTTQKLRQLTAGGEVKGGPSWSADSQQIIFTTTATVSKLSGIAMANVNNGAFRVLTQGGDTDAAISPNGTRLVFTSQRDGDAELYVLNLNTSAVERLTDNPGLDGGAVFISAPVDPARSTLPTHKNLLLERTRK